MMHGQPNIKIRRNGGEKANHFGTVLQGYDTIYLNQIFLFTD